MGWTGIYIEPDPVSYEKFVKDRPNDINLNYALGNEKAESTFYRLIFEENKDNALSTLSKDIAEYHEQKYSIISEEIKVKVLPLRDVLEIYTQKKILIL